MIFTSINIRAMGNIMHVLLSVAISQPSPARTIFQYSIVHMVTSSISCPLLVHLNFLILQLKVDLMKYFGYNITIKHLIFPNPLYHQLPAIAPETPLQVLLFYSNKLCKIILTSCSLFRGHSSEECGRFAT